MQGQSLEERQRRCTSPVVASCSREQRASGSAGAHQYRADLQVKTDEPATWEMMAATEEPMVEPAAEPPDEITEYRDDERCDSGQSRGDSRRKAPTGVARASDSKLGVALKEYKELAVRSGRPDAEGGSREDTDPASSADRQLGGIRGSASCWTSCMPICTPMPNTSSSLTQMQCSCAI